jgi:hypothetical protein
MGRGYPQGPLGGGMPSRPRRGVPVFFCAGAPPSPPPASRHEGGPPSRVPKVAPPSRFPARVSRRRAHFSFAPFWLQDPTPHHSFGEGAACPALLGGGGTPPSRHLSLAGTPLQGTQGGTPHPFSGTGLRRRLNSCHRLKTGSGGGTPSLPTVEDPHPLSFPWEGGTPLGRLGGGGGVKKNVGISPVYSISGITGLTPSGTKRYSCGLIRVVWISVYWVQFLSGKIKPVWQWEVRFTPYPVLDWHKKQASRFSSHLV